MGSRLSGPCRRESCGEGHVEIVVAFGPRKQPGLQGIRREQGMTFWHSVFCLSALLLMSPFGHTPEVGEPYCHTSQPPRTESKTKKLKA